MNKPIIIPVHNQLEYLIRCIDSVVEKTKNPDIIIIDDCSEDETRLWIEKSGFLYIRNDECKGFTASVNKGIDYAIKNMDFTYLCLLNSDTEIITDNWFDVVGGWVNHRTGVCGVVSDNAMMQSIKDVPLYLKTIDKRQPRRLALIHGFCYFISKNLLMKIGHLDEITFPHYGSEDDFSIKSVKNGFVNVLVTSVFVKHYGERSYSKEKREDIVNNTSLPLLLSKWGKQYVNQLVKEGMMVNNIINRYVW